MKATRFDKLSYTQTVDALSLVLGRKIGEGASRVVYQHAQMEKCVVKIEADGLHYCNANEAQIWDQLKGTKLEKWLCPVFLTAPFARAIVMAKAMPIQPHQLPPRIPRFLAHDLKPENWGIWNDHPVCLDYGIISIFRSLTKPNPARMVKADWLKHAAAYT